MEDGLVERRTYEWVLVRNLETWVRVAERDHQGSICAFTYAANCKGDVRDHVRYFVYKGQKGFAKLHKAYLDTLVRCFNAAIS